MGDTKSFSNYVKDADTNRNNALAEYMFDLLFFAVQVHTWHLQTGSYEVHMALGELYTGIPEVGDELAEALMAVTQQKLPTPSKSYCLTQSTSTPEEIVKAILTMKNIATEFFNATGDEAGINNTLANVVALLDKAIYKITQLR